MPRLVQFRMDRCIDGYEIVKIDGDAYKHERDEKDGLSKIIYAPGTPRLMRRLIEETGGRFNVFNPHQGRRYHNLYLVPKSEANECYEPLERHSNLFMEFADTPQTPEGAKAFADKFGLSDSFPWEPNTPIRSQPIFDFISDVRDLRTSIEIWRTCEDSGDFQPLINSVSHREHKSIGAALAAGQTVMLTGDGPPRQTLKEAESRMHFKFDYVPGAERPSLHMVPDTLFSAMFLQLVQAVSSNTQFRQCSCCPTWFAYGSGTGRRKSAHYCSARCRKAAYIERQEAKK